MDLLIGVDYIPADQYRVASRLDLPSAKESSLNVRLVDKWFR